MATWRQEVWFTPWPLEQMYASAAPVNMLAPEYTFDELTNTLVVVTMAMFNLLSVCKIMRQNQLIMRECEMNLLSLVVFNIILSCFDDMMLQ